MNGSKSTFKRKGYWLTAFAAAVLLAASPGTASAQIEIEGPDDDTVLEGDTVSYTVTVEGYIQPQETPAEGTLTVTMASPIGLEPTPDDPELLTEGEDNQVVGQSGDISENLGLELVIPIPEGEDLTGDPVRFSSSGIIRLPTTHDLDAEDEKFTVGFGAPAIVGPMLTVGEANDSGAVTLDAEDAPDELIIDDDEAQTYVFDVTTAKPTEGTNILVDLKADPFHVQASIDLTLHLDDGDYGHGQPDAFPIGTGTTVELNTQTITITTPSGANGDGNRVDDSVTLTAYSGVVGRAVPRATVTIKVADKNELPAVEMMVVEEDGDEIDPQPTSVKEGDTIHVAVMVVDEDGDETNATEALEVAVTATGTADSADYTLTGGPFKIKSDMSMSNVVELEVSSAGDDIGRESLMFDAVVSGDEDVGPGTSTSPGVLSLYIEDGTTPHITPNTSDADYDAIKAVIAAAGGDDEMLNPDPAESFTLMFGDLFTVMEGYTASYSFSQEGTSVSLSSTGEAITVTAEMAGRSEITINGTARLPVSSLEGSQTVANDASLKFPVEVVDGQLVVTVSADPMEIAEGGTSEITATASRAVTAGDDEVEVHLTVVGDGGELDADSITIGMGDKSGSAMLTAAEDDDFEDGTVTVVATGSGITGLMQVEVAVTDNDTAPPVPNQIEAKPQDEAYPVITAAIAAGAGEDEMLTYGESVALMASDLFTVMDGYAATYRVSVEGTAVTGSADGDSISVMAASAGDAKVTITGTAKMAASSFDASQDATNVASITFPVTVDPEPEPEPEPVPALPLIGQLLLGLGLLGGGVRHLYRRRQG